jgi:serine protease Do
MLVCWLTNKKSGHFMLIKSLCILFLLFLPLSVFAQKVEYFQIQSGTGFFVSRQYVITNAHVITGCSKVTIKGAVPEHDAFVKVMDVDHDLALLETDAAPNEFAPLRFNIEDMRPGDKVLIVGYPGPEGAQGIYKIAEAQIQELKREGGAAPGQFYISDVVQHGNSGGPVFDTSGNVIGVVVAKTVLYTINEQTKETISEQHAGVAISLATLKQFLLDHGVFTQWAGSGLLFTNNYIEERAKNYIVNVQCRMPASEHDYLAGTAAHN